MDSNIANSEREWAASREIEHLRAAMDEMLKSLQMSNSELLLMAGEMSTQELRTMRAVLNALVNRMHSRQ